MTKQLLMSAVVVFFGIFIFFQASMAAIPGGKTFKGKITSYYQIYDQIWV